MLRASVALVPITSSAAGPSSSAAAGTSSVIDLTGSSDVEDPPLCDGTHSRQAIAEGEAKQYLTPLSLPLPISLRELHVIHRWSFHSVPMPRPSAYRRPCNPAAIFVASLILLEEFYAHL